MQIRFANRQDEAPVRALVEGQGVSLDLNGADHDLHNLDQNYFGQDGLFVVAEADGKIVAFAGARRQANDSETLELVRFTVLPDYTAGGADSDVISPENIEKQFLAIIKNHAYQLDYKAISVTDKILPTQNE